MKKALKISGIAFAILLVAMIGMIIAVKSMGTPENVAAIQINEVDLQSINDGTYRGDCDAGLVKVVVDVTVKDHKISSIDIVKHDNGLGKKAEKIVNGIINQQSLQVDVISGATTSSKAILKAVETALTNKQ